MRAKCKYTFTSMEVVLLEFIFTMCTKEAQIQSHFVLDQEQSDTAAWLHLSSRLLCTLLRRKAGRADDHFSQYA